MTVKLPISLEIDNAVNLLEKLFVCSQDLPLKNVKNFFNNTQVDGDHNDYLNGTCDILTSDASGLLSKEAEFQNPEEHIILNERISKEPLAPL